MPNNIIITRPEHDPATRYLSYWSTNFIKLAQKKGHCVTDLKRNKATKKEFEGRVKKLNPSFVFLNGHGSTNCVTGHDNEPLVQVNKNDKILKNRVTYAVSCDSAKKLGLKCADKNTAYIGYNQAFVFNLNRKYLKDPLRDKRAGQFLEASNKVPIALIKGHTAKEASEISKNCFKNKIQKLLPRINDNPDKLEDVKDLFWDMNHQVCLGNGNATI